MDAVRKVASLRREGFGWVVDGDIRRYFENIPHDALLDRVEAVTGDDALLDLIGQWLEWYAPGGVGVPQGSPLSPLLANIYLDSVDEAIAGRGIRLVRYADDFLILAKSEAMATGAMMRIAEILAEHGLELNAEKSRVVSFEQGFRFLGHLFVRSMLVREIADDAPNEASVAALGLAAERIVAGETTAGVAAPPIGTWSPGWRVLYILEPSRALASEGESFIVTDRGATMFKLPAHRVGRIELAAEVPVNPKALDLAAAHDVLIARIDGHGATIAEWVPPGALALHGKRHLAQAAFILDPDRRLDLARTVVDARLRGQRAVLSRANRDRRDTEISAVIGKWRGVLRSAGHADRLDRLMGIGLHWRARWEVISVSMASASEVSTQNLSILCSMPLPTC
jgi:CRISPR-associated protein Cas1